MVLIYAKNAGVDYVIMLMAQCGTVEKHFKANELQKVLEAAALKVLKIQ